MADGGPDCSREEAGAAAWLPGAAPLGPIRQTRPHREAEGAVAETAEVAESWPLDCTLLLSPPPPPLSALGSCVPAAS